ncbi:MotA/TolQ/ExbB proton channel family protein [Myroides odoratus]|uniref:Colicin uptake protein TolQ n=1 Tax=Myroides odoratus TaxID=256 RepID=A0A378U6U8_MYROD|nr:MotA/TolQ/ExbB proton channel family protein [Myroides odoratus]QQU02705.1 MotA/TolQ/ExbB proton channel family protein [Myroides odoratus]STZ70072.1 colicin uptake protein TolQ [Myroides odoratus]
MFTFLQASPDAITTAVTDLNEVVTQESQISALDFVLKGGIFMIPIILLFIYTIYLSIERYLYIRKQTKYDATVLPNTLNLLEKGQMDSVDLTLSRDNNSYTKVILEGTHSIGRPITEIEANMERLATIEIGKMEKKMAHLGLIAGIAPTLGFVGTILGVIRIFYNISISEDISIANISGGLYEKMISSGSGLVVGIIAYAAYHLLNSSIDTYLLNTQQTILDFINAIQRPNGNQKK